MMTAEMISKLSTISSRWTKGDMDRMYINIDAANELYMSIETREHGQLTMNRRERQAGKIWIDVITGEISTKGISDSDEVISEIEELINHLCPADETAEETTDEENDNNEEDENMIRIEICCDRWTDGQGWQTKGNVLDVDYVSTTNDLNDLDMACICENAGYKFEPEDGIDYRLWLRAYDQDGNEIKHDVDAIWASEL